jgi:hypothetical protein
LCLINFISVSYYLKNYFSFAIHATQYHLLVVLPNLLRKQEVTGRTNRLVSLIRDWPHRRWLVQQFLSYCVCILWRDNLFTEPLPSNDRRIHVQTHKLMGGIYEVRRWDGFKCHDTHTKSHKDWSRHSKVNGTGGESRTHRQHGNLISLFLFFIFQYKESRIKMYVFVPWRSFMFCFMFTVFRGWWPDYVFRSALCVCVCVYLAHHTYLSGWNMSLNLHESMDKVVIKLMTGEAACKTLLYIYIYTYIILSCVCGYRLGFDWQLDLLNTYKS